MPTPIRRPFLDAEGRVLPRSAYISDPRIDTLTVDNNVQVDFATGALRHTVLTDSTICASARPP